MHAQAEAFHRPVQDAQGRPPQAAVALMQVTREAEEADGFRGEEVPERDVARGLGTAEQMRQALGAVQGTEPIGQVDPVPRLFDLVVGQPAIELAFQDKAGVVGAELRERAHLDHVVHAGPQARLDSVYLPPLQQVAEAGLGRFDRRFTQLAALEKVDVLPADGGKLVAQVLALVQVPAKQESGSHQDRQQHAHDEDQPGGHDYQSFARRPGPEKVCGPLNSKVQTPFPDHRWLLAHLPVAVHDVLVASQF